MNRSQISARHKRLNQVNIKQGRNCIFPSYFWGKLILPILKLGGFPKRSKSNISETVTSTATKLSGFEETMDLHTQYFFKIFRTEDWGTPLPQQFFDEFVEYFRKQKLFDIRWRNSVGSSTTLVLLFRFFDFFNFFRLRVTNRERPNFRQNRRGANNVTLPGSSSQ